jgi:hypothetical protein
MVTIPHRALGKYTTSRTNLGVPIISGDSVDSIDWYLYNPGI